MNWNNNNSGPWGSGSGGNNPWGGGSSNNDFEKTMKLWLQAEDNWKDFFRDDDEAIKQQHWFGQYSYSTDNKWGYLTASIFGPQNSEGQFHKNCYTEKKIRNMMRFLNFEILDMSFFRWKDDRDHMIRVRASKIK